MSGKIFARVPALSLALLLAACGGGGDSTPLVDTENGGGNGGAGEEGAVGIDGLALGNGSNDNFNAGQVSASIINLSPGGLTLLEVSAVDSVNGNKLLSGQEVEITFSSGCLDNGQASLSENPITTLSGTAKVTYTAKGCSGQDSVKAVASGAEASVVLNIDPSIALTLTALAPEPNSISPSNVAGNSLQTPRRASSIVKFQLEDKDQNGVSGADVSFRLFPISNLGDKCPSQIGLNTRACIPAGLETAKTGPDGVVSTTLIAGKNNEVIRVIATAENSKIQTTSAPIAINSFIPTAKNFSLSIDDFSLDAWGKDNISTNVTITAGDRYGTAIRGNTIINFTTSNGIITPDCELDNSGACSVSWNSVATSEARPRITAYTQGERLVSGTDCDLPSTTNCVYKPDTLQVSTRIVQSSSENTQVTLSEVATNRYCAITRAVLGGSANVTVPPPSGTKIDFTIENGEFKRPSQANKVVGKGFESIWDYESSSYKVDYTACLDVIPDAGASASVRVLVTLPNGSQKEDNLLR